jgi:hypothetical protein
MNIEKNICAIFLHLPIDNDWIRRSLISITTAFLIAATTRLWVKDEKIQIDIMKLIEYNNYNKIFYAKINYLHITSWVRSTRHISGFLSCPS